MSRTAAAGATRKNSLPQRAAGLAQQLGLWLRRILAGAFVLAAVAVVILAGRQLQQMPIERVVVSGSLQQVSREQIQQMVMAGLWAKWKSPTRVKKF